MMKYQPIKSTEIREIPMNEIGEKHLTTSIQAVNLNIKDAQISKDNYSAKVIKTLERFCRGSYEYKSYINYLKNELDIKSCSILNTINIDEIQVSLEFHHCPISMYDVCDIVARSMIDVDDYVSAMDICERVMLEHYNNNIGLIPLTSTMHKLVHSGSIIIPPTKVYGNWQRFVEKYHNYIDNDLLIKINEFAQIKEDDANKVNDAKLKKAIYDYDITYEYKDYDEEDDEPEELGERKRGI